ncbi:hypothetical protein NNJEOMEG_02732 [Fundidesulfovibrio magnetotacticus]|uniref:Transmembrane protein n=1 Tax=Fundidesulfovibrio magnetotacticus TaxID=2730080 RepID=A0A6V8LT35_9BACT|nr:hypothetical protein NNJEOMEG_02732 [Fundidesulfovibrio magnetotacticus]
MFSIWATRVLNRTSSIRRASDQLFARQIFRRLQVRRQRSSPGPSFRVEEEKGRVLVMFQPPSVGCAASPERLRQVDFIRRLKEQCVKNKLTVKRAVLIVATVCVVTSVWLMTPMYRVFYFPMPSSRFRFEMAVLFVVCFAMFLLRCRAFVENRSPVVVASASAVAGFVVTIFGIVYEQCRSCLMYGCKSMGVGVDATDALIVLGVATFRSWFVLAVVIALTYKFLPRVVSACSTFWRNVKSWKEG